MALDPKRQNQQPGGGRDTQLAEDENQLDDLNLNQGEDAEGGGLGRKPMHSNDDQQNSRSANMNTLDNEDYQEDQSEEELDSDEADMDAEVTGLDSGNSAEFTEEEVETDGNMIEDEEDDGDELDGQQEDEDLEDEDDISQK